VILGGSAANTVVREKRAEISTKVKSTPRIRFENMNAPEIY
jgi:hypothetical protein